MSSEKIQDVVDRMDPQQAVDEIAQVVKSLLPSLGEEARLRFIMELVGDSGEDKIAGMVHL